MKQFISILLSIFLLASSSGVAYAQHYCGEYKMIEKLTLGEEHLSCGMVLADTSCGDEHAEDHDCCDNEYTQVSTDDNFAKAHFDINFDSPFVAAFVSVFVLNVSLTEDASVTSYTDYNPPPLIKDIPVLYETFLI
ncbi:hypothetical protein ACFQO1_03070 [Jejudonia soesokkakensis]|uniref:Secreted protein n=1 Tax=Jejudonia soesokkakensis TaxID=1323432 RepID=A0ABW2MSX2_9FLAO